MKAVILAAGQGIRMRPLTLTTPKPLLPVNGKPIIDYIFDSLPFEIDEVIIAVLYLGDKLKKHFGSERRGKQIRYVQGSDEGTAYSFLAAKKYLSNERFLLVHGDELTHKIDIINCLQKDLSILVFKPENPSACGMAYLKKDGSIKKIVEKPKKTTSKLAVDGVMVLNTDIFDYTPKITNGEFYLSTLVSLFAKDHKITPVELQKTIIGITVPSDLERAGNIIKTSIILEKV